MTLTRNEARILSAGVLWLLTVYAWNNRGPLPAAVRADVVPFAEQIEPIDDDFPLAEIEPPAEQPPPQPDPAPTPEEQPRPNVLTPAPPPLEIRIVGPVDSLVGDMVELTAETTQDVTQFAWSIQPPVRGLIVMDGGTKAVFANRDAGDYLIICSTANAVGQVAHATMPFTLRPAPPENPLTVESLAEANPPPDLRDLIRRWAAEVVTNNKRGEASAVATSFRNVATLLQTGKIAMHQDADPLYEVERAAEQSMGPQNFAKWESFFRRVRDFLHPLNVRGHIVSPAQYANTFNNLAREIEEIAAGR